MPIGIDAIQLYHRAFEQGISIVPGPLFSLANKYGNHIRLSAALWDERVEQGIKTLGKLAHELLPG
jgi:DNA-binding transcriptional MocR family regulator